MATSQTHSLRGHLATLLSTSSSLYFFLSRGNSKTLSRSGGEVTVGQAAASIHILLPFRVQLEPQRTPWCVYQSDPPPWARCLSHLNSHLVRRYRTGLPTTRYHPVSLSRSRICQNARVRNPLRNRTPLCWCGFCWFVGFCHLYQTHIILQLDVQF